MNSNRRPLFFVVEDNANDEEMTLRALRQEIPNLRIAVARDGDEAIRALHGSVDLLADELPDLVLLDLKLPRFSGLEVLHAIRAGHETKALPVVFFSSSDEEGDVFESYRAGANTYVKKPVDFDEYTAVVRRIAAYWSQTARLPDPSPSTVA